MGVGSRRIENHTAPRLGVSRNPLSGAEIARRGRAPEFGVCYARTWQATQWPREISFRTCSFSEQEGTRMAQRVWNRHPEGGLMGLGTSPSRMIRFRLTAGSGMGTAESSASVYGCLGLL